ncbi:STAS domain-containing protein [Streptomyces flaveolus]|uniref:STAS domain-containing protein n=1 Tax=Streptomyces flaveolus TaxID=67297 RepID=UPI0036F8CDC9
MFSVDVRQDGQRSVFALRGELDYDSMEQLHEAGEKELVKGREAGPVVIDCAALSFCDSSGIGALLRFHQQMSSQSRALRLASVPTNVSRLFELTGLDQVFSVHADVADALTAGRREDVAPDAQSPARSSEGHRP